MNHLAAGKWKAKPVLTPTANAAAPRASAPVSAKTASATARPAPTENAAVPKVNAPVAEKTANAIAALKASVGAGAGTEKDLPAVRAINPTPALNLNGEGLQAPPRIFAPNLVAGFFRLCDGFSPPPAPPALRRARSGVPFAPPVRRWTRRGIGRARSVPGCPSRSGRP